MNTPSFISDFNKAMMSEDKERVRTLLGKMKWNSYLESNSIILTAPGVTPSTDSFFNDMLPMFVESGYNPLHDQCIHYLAGAKNKTRFAAVYDLCAGLGLTTKNGNTFTHVVAFMGDVTASRDQLKNYAERELAQTNDAGQTPLHLFVRSLSRITLSKSSDIVLEEARFLTSLGADWSAWDKKHKTPLCLLKHVHKEFLKGSRSYEDFGVLSGQIKSLASKQNLEQHIKSSCASHARTPKKL